LLGDGASWLTVVEEGEPVDTAGTGASTSKSSQSAHQSLHELSQ
ncbi:hypothetical protein Tco_0632101, partial [Tanacetum coccineum]